MALDKDWTVVGQKLNFGPFQSLATTFKNFFDKRASFGLTNPGTFENVNREVHKDVLLTKSMFTGLRADFNRPLSISPLFQYSHAFALGSQGFPPYGFSALLGTKDLFMQGNIDNEGQLGATLNYQWNKSLVSKCQASLAPRGDQSMLQLDTEYAGEDFSASLKSINPSLFDGAVCGIFIGSYLQSVTRKLALGTEIMYQRPGISQGPEAVVSYCARYKTDDWIASAQLQAQGALSTTYWRRLTEKVEAGVDLSLQLTPGMGGLAGPGLRKEGTTTIGAKYDFRTSTFRAQVDSSGKVSALLEKRVLPPVQITFSGEMDHVKATSKIGVAVSVETTPEDVAIQASQTQPTSVPF